MELGGRVLSCLFTLQNLNPAYGGWETSKARNGLSHTL